MTIPATATPPVPATPQPVATPPAPAPTTPAAATPATPTPTPPVTVMVPTGAPHPSDPPASQSPVVQKFYLGPQPPTTAAPPSPTTPAPEAPPTPATPPTPPPTLPKADFQRMAQEYRAQIEVAKLGVSQEVSEILVPSLIAKGAVQLGADGSVVIHQDLVAASIAALQSDFGSSIADKATQAMTPNAATKTPGRWQDALRQNLRVKS